MKEKIQDSKTRTKQIEKILMCPAKVGVCFSEDDESGAELL